MSPADHLAKRLEKLLDLFSKGPDPAIEVQIADYPTLTRFPLTQESADAVHLGRIALTEYYTRPVYE